MNEVNVADQRSVKIPVIHCGEDDFFWKWAQLPVRAAVKALARHSSVKREAAPVCATISTGKGVEHAPHQGFLFIQEADELTRIEVRIKELGFFSQPVAFGEMGNSFHRSLGSGELLSSGF